MSFDLNISLGHLLTIASFIIAYIRWSTKNEMRIQALQEWTESHEKCHDKLVEIQGELRNAVAFLKGRMRVQ